MKARIDYLLKQYFYNKSSRQELEEFFALIQSARHDRELVALIRERYEELKRQDPSASYVDENGELNQLSEIVDPSPSTLVLPSKSAGRRLAIYGSVAACVAMLFIGFYYGQRLVQTEGEAYVQVIKSVANDEKKMILLGDGTKVWVNGSSKLEYPQRFVKGEPREVTLHGEAYFEVERSEEWPFIVHTGEIETKVLGTKFNIRAYPELGDVLVTVRSGKVQVNKQRKRVATLVGNQEVSVPRSVEANTPKVVEKELKSKVAGNWIQGYLEYEDEPISTIIADLERARGMSIEWRKSSTAEKIITMSVPMDSSADYILEVLSTLTDSRIQKEGKSYIIF